MVSKAFKRGADLRQRLKQARNGETIVLPLQGNDFGEYQGPIILTKPVILVGQGSKTAILGKGCPAVIVRSPGVTLKNLELADSYDPVNGTSLLIEDHALPTLDPSVKICGRNVTMSKEQIIDLGDFLPLQQASSFLEVEVKGPSRVRCNENSAKWMRVSPETFPGAGKYLLQIGCDAKALGSNAFAAGSFEILTGTDVQLIWVTLHVLSAAPAKLLTGQMALLLGKDQRIRFSNGYIIGKQKFPGTSAANSIAEKQAYILKETGSNAWVLFQPWQTSTPTQINGQPISQGQRILLQDGYQIRAGGLDLKVEAFTAASYGVDKTVVDLGVAGSAPASGGFQLRYTGSGKDRVEIFTTVPWLQATPNKAELKKNDIISISVSTTAAVAKLPAAKMTEVGAILVQSKNETLSIDACIDVKPASVIPRAVPDEVKFGVVPDWTKANISLDLLNDGTVEWRPAIKNAPNWLTIEPANPIVPPGKSTKLTLRLNQKAENLPSPSDQTTVVSFEGEGVSFPVKVSARIQLDLPDPALDPPAILDFGELTDWERATPATLFIRNKGKKDWHALARTTENWLEILGEKSIILAPGKQKTISVQLNGSLPVGSHNLTEAVIIEGDGKKIAAGAKVKLLAPTSEIDIFPRQVDFGKFDNIPSLAAQQVTFRNRGNADWEGSIRCSLSWLERVPSGDTWRCAAKSEETITLRVNQRLGEGQYSIPDGVIFEGPGGPYLLPVKAHFEPVPLVRSIPVDFGTVPGWDVAPTMTIPVFNDGSKDWDNVTVSSALPWLSVSPGSINVPTRGKAEIQVRLNQNLDGQKSGTFDVPNAILLAGGGIQLNIGAKLVLPPYELKANLSEVSFSLDAETDLSTASQRLVVTNVGGRNWDGKIEARDDWLKVEPGRANIGANGTLNILVSVGDSARNKGAPGETIGSLITFENTDLSLGAWVKISKPVEKDNLECEPSPLDFGKIEEGMPIPRTRLQLEIYNDYDWQATFTAQDNWFKLDRDEVSGLAKTTSYVKVELNDQAARLTEGVHWSEITITTKGGRSRSIPVRIEKTEISPDFVFKPPRLEMAWHLSEGDTPPQKIVVENRGNKEWKVALEVAESWLEVRPTNFVVCPALGKVEFQVGMAEQAKTLREGRYNQELTLRVGSKYRLPFQSYMEIDRSVYDWDVRPEGITFGQVERSSNWDLQPAEELTIRNKGNHEITLSVSISTRGGQWLESTPAGSIKVAAHSERKLSLKLKKDAWGALRLGKQEGIIELSGAGKPVQLIATLQLTGKIVIVSPVPPTETQPHLLPLNIEPVQLVFTETDPSQWSNVPPQTIKLYNPNGIEWAAGLVRCKEWLSVEPKTLNIPAYGERGIEVKLKPTLWVKAGETRQENDAEAVTIQRGSETYSIGVIVDQGRSPYPETKPPSSFKPTDQPPPPPVETETVDKPGKLFGPKSRMDQSQLTQPERQKPEGRSTIFDPKPSGSSDQVQPGKTGLSNLGLFAPKDDPLDPSQSRPTLPSTKEPTGLTTDSIKVQPLRLDFGWVSDWDKTPAQTISIRSKHSRPVNIHIDSVDWLKVSNADLTVPANGTAVFQVALQKPRGAFAQPRKGIDWDPRAVIIVVEGFSFPIAVNVETQ